MISRSGSSAPTTARSTAPRIAAQAPRASSVGLAPAGSATVSVISSGWYAASLAEVREGRKTASLWHNDPPWPVAPS